MLSLQNMCPHSTSAHNGTAWKQLATKNFKEKKKIINEGNGKEETTFGN